jgi:hypothetical protein
MKTTVKLGKWLAICDRCGFRFYNDELRKDWQGLMVDSACFETRHPQDLIRVRHDNPAVAWVRPEPEDLFGPDACTIIGLSAIPGFAIPGCSIPSRTFLGDAPSLKDYLDDATAVSFYAVAGIAVAGTL